MSEFLVSLLGERLVNSEKAEVDVQSLGAKLSLVGLFFGCSLNAPCKQFNGSLCEFYSRFKKTSEHKDKLEIVFISSDPDQKHWQDFLQEMPWPALPFKDRHKKVRWAIINLQKNTMQCRTLWLPAHTVFGGGQICKSSCIFMAPAQSMAREPDTDIMLEHRYNGNFA
uniref:Thioredoxin-like fold domain-containing protein n=1 Tax=Amphilophus citrinellus TaxID=61819 RepID=A0A3Q0RCX8_AMPCI